jgi:hypothetical protein
MNKKHFASTEALETVYFAGGDCVVPSTKQERSSDGGRENITAWEAVLGARRTPNQFVFQIIGFGL